MQVLSVELDDRSYPIYIGNSLLDQPLLVKKHVKASQVLIVTNQTIAPLYLEQTQRMFSDFNCCSQIILQDGECYKSLRDVAAHF
jgi:3-dehydroquinate synthase